MSVASPRRDISCHTSAWCPLFIKAVRRENRCRHVLVQAAWCNARAPKKPSADIQENLPAWVVESSRTAQKRLYSRFRHLENTVGRHKAVVAIARELIGFLGATLIELATEPQGNVQPAQ